MKSRLFLVYFNVSLLCVLLVGLELTGQVAYFLLKGYPVYQSDQHLLAQGAEQPFEIHPFLVGRLRGGRRTTQGGNTLTATPGHTRWTGAASADSAKVRIALVGGSTTFGAGVTDSATWPARLQARLGSGYAVTNFGMPGFSSAEGVIQMALLVPESRPDLVVFYEGWNDLHNFHDAGLGPDYYGHGMRQYSNLDIERPQPTGLFAKLVEVSAIFRLAAVVSHQLAPPEKANPQGARSPAAMPRSAPDTFVERIYRRNLGAMRTLAEEAGAVALFVPQILDSSRLKGDGGGWWTPGVQNRAVPEMLRRLNGILSNACAGRGDRCAVLDVGAARAWRPEDFIDEGHFSPQGNDAFAEVVAAWIAEEARTGSLRQVGPALSPVATPSAAR
jgi:lysophospholipase L1-like esterase